MRVIEVRRYGAPDVLEPAERPSPEPGPGEVRVDVCVAGVNFVDVYHREGRYHAPLPFVPGHEGAGVVSAVGLGVDGLAVGDRVVSYELRGSYAEQAVVAADRAVPVPGGVDLDTAAGVFTQGLTAHSLLFDSYPVRSGDTVLVHAAAGGVGLLLTQIATRLGARVIGTVSTPQKAALVRAAGAVEVIGYADAAAAVASATGGKGVPVVYDGVGRDTFDQSLRALRRRGVLVLYGGASGPVPPFDPMRLMEAGSVYLTRPRMGDSVRTAEELRRRAGDLFDWLADGMTLQVHGRYPLAEAARAHADLQGRRTTGKLLLTP